MLMLVKDQRLLRKRALEELEKLLKDEFTENIFILINNQLHLLQTDRIKGIVDEGFEDFYFMELINLNTNETMYHRLVSFKYINAGDKILEELDKEFIYYLQQGDFDIEILRKGQKFDLTMEV